MAFNFECNFSMFTQGCFVLIAFLAFGWTPEHIAIYWHAIRSIDGGFLFWCIWAFLVGFFVCFKFIKKSPWMPNSSWMPIDTIPKNERVLLYDKGIMIGCWKDNWADCENPINPTHWMPLPEPPRK